MSSSPPHIPRSESAASLLSQQHEINRSTPHRRTRLGNLKGFLPLNESGGSSVISARGQNLPHLLSHGLVRRGSGIWYHEHEAAAERGSFRDRSSGMGMVNGFALPESGSARGSRSGSLEQDDNLSDGGLGMTMGLGRDALQGDKRRRPSLDARGREASFVLVSEQMRSQRLIGNSNPRYRWEQYWKTEEQLKEMRKPIRKYYERNNSLVQQYTFIDRLLDSSLPHDLIQEYSATTPSATNTHVPPTICEECGDLRNSSTPTPPRSTSTSRPTTETVSTSSDGLTPESALPKVKRTPKNLYKIPESPHTPTPTEGTPLLRPNPEDPEEPSQISPMPEWTPEEEADSSSKVVSFAIYLNLTANIVLLILKIIVAVMTSSVSVLASLVDAALDFLSTAIVFVTTRIINRNSASDKEKYPVGRRRLEPIGVLVFSVIMITAFVQVALEGFSRLSGGDHTAVQLTISAIAIMASTVGIKGLCWLWCKAIRNSSVQALAQDAMTDVIFNIFSIIFPLIGFYADVWWLDPVGGIVLSCYVILNWSGTTAFHIARLTGAAATADERNVLLYLTMRFAKTIRKIQGLNAYHAGDKLNVEVDIVLDEQTSLRDSHDLGESLQYVLESVPYVDRAFVHLDYLPWNVSGSFDWQVMLNELTTCSYQAICSSKNDVWIPMEFVRMYCFIFILF